MSEEEYYELLREARDSVSGGGLEKCYARMLRSGSKYTLEYTFWNWFVGPWLNHHDILDRLEGEYGDE